MLGAELVSGLVAVDAQNVEQLSYLRVEAQLTVDTVEKIRLAGLFIKVETRAGRQVLGQRFAELALLSILLPVLLHCVPFCTVPPSTVRGTIVADVVDLLSLDTIPQAAEIPFGGTILPYCSCRSNLKR